MLDHYNYKEIMNKYEHKKMKLYLYTQIEFYLSEI